MSEPLLGPVTLLGDTLKKADQLQPVDTASALQVTDNHLLHILRIDQSCDLGCCPHHVMQGKFLALYFSAHWCPPCRAFTPLLRKYYAAHNTKHPKFPLEVVFISADNSPSEYQEYFRDMPWLSVPYEKSELRNALSRRFKVMGIPTLVILDPQGQVVNRNARSALIKDSEGKNFPWHGDEDTSMGGGMLMPIIVLLVMAIAYWLLYPRG